MSLAPGSLLAQIRPANTTAAAGFTAIIQTEILRVVIANTTGSSVNSALTFNLYGVVASSR